MYIYLACTCVCVCVLYVLFFLSIFRSMSFACSRAILSWFFPQRAHSDRLVPLNIGQKSTQKFFPFLSHSSHSLDQHLFFLINRIVCVCVLIVVESYGSLFYVWHLVIHTYIYVIQTRTLLSPIRAPNGKWVFVSFSSVSALVWAP